MTILRLFVKNSLGNPIFEVASNPTSSLHTLFPPPTISPKSAFHIRLEPTPAEERIVDLSSVLNTKQIKAFDERYVILPGASKINEVVARGIYFRNQYDIPDGSASEHLLSLLDASQRVLVKPYEILDHLTAHGYRYLGSHVEGYGRQGQICDVHTFLLQAVPREKVGRPPSVWVSLENTRETHTIDEEEDDDDDDHEVEDGHHRAAPMLMPPQLSQQEMPTKTTTKGFAGSVGGGGGAGGQWMRRWQVTTSVAA